MADGQLSRPLPPRLHPDPRHARRPRLRLAMGSADEGHRSDGLDDRTPLRNRLRKARPQQAPRETDDRSFRQAEAERSEERRVGKGCRGRMSAEDAIKEAFQGRNQGAAFSGMWSRREKVDKA